MNDDFQAPMNPFGSASAAAPPAQAAAMIAREVSQIQGAITLAVKRPRNHVQAMDRILQGCTRPTLAAMAEYSYPRGDKTIEGPSIRLLEEIARGWGNMMVGVIELERRAGVSEGMAYAWDLESNLFTHKNFTVRHLRDTKRGPVPLTDERDIYELVMNMGMRRQRACMESVIPADVIEAARNQVALTLKATADVTPDTIKKLLEGFDQFGVTREMLEARVQRRLDTISSAMLIQLRRVYTALRDNMAKVEDYFTVAAPAEDEGAPAPATRTAAVREQMRARRGKGGKDGSGNGDSGGHDQGGAAGTGAPQGGVSQADQGGQDGPAAGGEGVGGDAGNP